MQSELPDLNIHREKSNSFQKLRPNDLQSPTSPNKEETKLESVGGMVRELSSAR